LTTKSVTPFATAKAPPFFVSSDAVVQAVEKPKRPHKFVKIGRHKQGVP